MSADWTCLVVDTTGGEATESWEALVATHDFGCAPRLVTTLPEALVLLESERVLVQAILAEAYTPEVQALLRSFQTNVGCIAEFQALICDDPMPPFMAGVYEFGVEQFIARENWLAEVAVIARHAVAQVADPSSAEAKIIQLYGAIRDADQAGLQAATKALGDLVEYDYRAAFAKGKAAESIGDYGSAAEAFKRARDMNQMFRPSSSSLGESWLVTGRIDDALEIFKGLEESNPYDAECKAHVASAYVEKGDFVVAQDYLGAASRIEERQPKVLEVRAQILLCTGKVTDAFTLMDGMSDVGPYFAAKLNELGIRLSQSGKSKSALALYQRAHKIVRPGLRYKITLNAALACLRLQAWDMATKYSELCEKEFGGRFPKLDKVREAIAQGRAKSAQQGAKNDPLENDPLDEVS